MRAVERQEIEDMMSSEANIFEFDPREAGIKNVVQEVDSDAPNPTSPEWSEYVFSKFLPDELIEINGEKYPNCYGLRRVVEETMGEVVESKPVNIIVSSDATSTNPGRVTCHYEVTIRSYHNGKYKTVGDVAEVFALNSDDLFLGHPAATATTRAEGRCLRKLLKLKCVAAEELTKNKDVAKAVKEAIKSTSTDGNYNENDKITQNQINFIKVKCDQMNIDINKFINSGENRYANIEDISKKVASLMIQTLNDYQNNKKKIPESWRTE